MLLPDDLLVAEGAAESPGHTGGHDHVASDEARFVTGAEFVLDGGFTAN